MLNSSQSSCASTRDITNLVGHLVLVGYTTVSLDLFIHLVATTHMPPSGQTTTENCHETEEISKTKEHFVVIHGVNNAFLV